MRCLTHVATGGGSTAMSLQLLYMFALRYAKGGSLRRGCGGSQTLYFGQSNAALASDPTKARTLSRPYHIIHTLSSHSTTSQYGPEVHQCSLDARQAPGDGELFTV
jgi:hypothetical protein